MNIYKSLTESCRSGRKQIAVLIDPDKNDERSISHIVELSVLANIDYFFVGGSILHSSMEVCIANIKKQSDIPVILFPGNVMQLCDLADAILFLSLTSGRNPEFLIGHHVLAAPSLRKSKIEVIPTAYIIIENGKRTSVEYMSNTIPIPAEKNEIATATAMAGEMLGLKMTYLEAGSGASETVGLKMISEVKKSISHPLIVGGGVRTTVNAINIYRAGADLIVIGNALESDPGLIVSVAESRKMACLS